MPVLDSVETTIQTAPTILSRSEVRVPLELGDIFCQSFVRQNAGVLISVSFHLLLMLGISKTLIPAHSGPSKIVLEALWKETIEPEVAPVTVVAEVSIDNEQPDTLEQLSDTLEEEAPAANSLEPAAATPRVATTGDSNSRSETAVKPDSDGPPPTPTPKGEPGESEEAAEFFGTRVEGKSFVYILDRSGSMRSSSKNKSNSRLELAKAELLHSVNQLNETQSFYVMLFSSSTLRMFEDKSSRPKLIPATRENKKRLAKWLESVEANGSTNPTHALDLAIKMKPSSVFLLSDGVFDSNSAVEAVMGKGPPEKRRRNISPINTIAMDNTKAAIQLRRIADATGGKLRVVKSDGQNIAIQDLVSKSSQDDLSWDARYQLASDKGVNLLKNPKFFYHQTANQVLHDLSHGYFEDNQALQLKNATPEQVADQWASVWNQANQLQQYLRQTNPNRLSFQASEPPVKDPAIWFMVLHSSMDEANPSIQPNVGIPGSNDVQKEIERAEFLLKVQSEYGSTVSIRQSLITALDRLSVNPIRRRSSLLSRTDSKTWEKRYRNILRDRDAQAGKFYAQLIHTRQAKQRTEIKSQILKQFPETEYARKLGGPPARELP